VQDPNALSLTLPEGLVVTSRVLRRSEEQVADDRFETSEFLQQVFDDGSLGGLLGARLIVCVKAVGICMGTAHGPGKLPLRVLGGNCVEPISSPAE